jgi:hypothetical protein
MAEAMPILKKYLQSWDILTEPISHAIGKFTPFINFAQSHTQTENPYCANCPDTAICKCCPLIVLYDPQTTYRCQLAKNELTSLMFDVSTSAVPRVKDNVRLHHSRAYLRISTTTNEYTSEKEFKLNKIAQSIWRKIDGRRSIAAIKEKLIKESSYSADEISVHLDNFLNCLWKEGILEFGQNE